ncbi:nucleotide exchange factor GrpE [Lacticaseibacillus mingshuiensis]|uniref:Protein GrpE n=1 Tax=Lacticaseibacillus mingshuiensis TaxID=2799574 RepID=A0ABW4CML0_9LACO|nr:nucleotide exchange factor GrpE [Lacticaseibacillus mingshuiensis]
MTDKKTEPLDTGQPDPATAKEKPVETDTHAAKKSLKDEIADEMSADLDQQIKASDVDVTKLQQERDDFEDKYLRAAAEISNMSNRFKKESAQLVKYDGQKLATAVLPVLDNLERALSTDVSDDGAASLKKGVEMVHTHLAQALKDNNVDEIELAAGDKFDPTIAQAVQTIASDKDHPQDTIAQVLQKGYRLKDRVLRPAMVVVAN